MEGFINDPMSSDRLPRIFMLNSYLNISGLNTRPLNDLAALVHSIRYHPSLHRSHGIRDVF